MRMQAESDHIEVERTRHSDDRGASLVEYALLVALIAIACIVAVTYFGSETGDTFSRVGSSVVSA